MSISDIASLITVGATILGAIVAYVIYLNSKKDELQNATRIIILEIRESERIIKNLSDIKNAGGMYPDDLIKVTPFKGWAKYSHMFIQKMNNDEYDQVSEYFKKCEILEKFLEKNHNFFWITTEERARQKEIMGAKLAIEFSELSNEDFKKKVDTLSQLYFSNTTLYSPAGIATQIDRILNSISLITPTPTWNKIKRIAKYKDMLG